MAYFLKNKSTGAVNAVVDGTTPVNYVFSPADANYTSFRIEKLIIAFASTNGAETNLGGVTLSTGFIFKVQKKETGKNPIDHKTLLSGFAIKKASDFFHVGTTVQLHKNGSNQIIAAQAVIEFLDGVDLFSDQSQRLCLNISENLTGGNLSALSFLLIGKGR